MKKQIPASDKIELNIFRKYILPELKKIYFFGYPLSAINDLQVFRRLCSLTSRHLGFCIESAAINMLALKDVPNVRLIYGRSDMGGWHSWVEVEKDGIALAIDSCWIYSDLGQQPNCYFMESERYYEEKGLTPITTYTHKEFWDYEFSQKLYDRLRNPRETALPSCLVEIYRIMELHRKWGQLNYQIYDFTNDGAMQRQFVAQTIRNGFLPHHPRETIKRLMEDASLGFNFKQPSTIVPGD